MTDPLQKDYSAFLQDLTIERTRVGCIIAAVLIPATLVIDYFSSVTNLTSFVIVRFSCAIVSISLFAILFTSLGRKSAKFIGYILYLVVAFTIAILIRLMGGYETPYYAGLNLVFLGGAVLMPWTLKESTFIFFAIYSFYIVPILLLDQIKVVPVFVSNNVFLIETLLIALASNYFTSKMRHREFSARFELEKARDELKELDKTKTQFFSTVSHELRTPLANIMLPIQNILFERGEYLDSDNKKEKEAMLRNARKLMKRINEILDISKLEAGEMQIMVGPEGLNSILEEIVMASSIGAKEMGIKLKCKFENKLPMIYVDREKIEKVSSNLIGNALKFTNQGGSVTVKTRETINQVEIIVHDTGVGIASESLPHIFDRFRQVDGSSSRKYEGTGLGLTIVKEFVQLHHGTIEVSSELGRGTAFTVGLLKGVDHFKKEQIKEEFRFETSDGLKERRSSERRKQDRRRHERRQMADEDRDTIDSLQVQLSDLENGKEYPDKEIWDTGIDEKKKDILVVEDNKDLVSNIARSLIDIYNVSAAYNGRQGLEMVKRKIPDLILSDVMMPEMDGFELCERLKSDKLTQHIPLILLTAKATTNDKIEGLKHGADHYLAKPFNPNELRAVAESLLTKKELEAELSKSNLELTNTLRKLEEAQVQLVHAARLESVGLLAAGIAHEIKNNIYCVRAGLTGINKRLTLLSEGQLDIEETSESLKKALKTNDQAIDSSISVINSLLAFSGKEKGGRELCDINTGIENTITLLLPRIKDKLIVHKSFGETQKVECSIEEINQVIMNIVLNAYQAAEGSGEINIKTTQGENDVRISIADDGPGIAEENLEKIFLPFFSTKEKKINTGLGLSICYNIIKNHHGKIDVKSNLGRGTEFIISLPILQPDS